MLAPLAPFAQQLADLMQAAAQPSLSKPQPIWSGMGFMTMPPVIGQAIPIPLLGDD
jgi:hypothetical protein